MTKCLKLENVSINYGNFSAVQEASLTLDAGEIGCLLGPSGCGKTTLLRAIAGFEAVCGGQIILDQEVLSSTTQTCPPEQRRVGMVFQDFALFPHLDVESNVGFGLQHLPQGQRQARIQTMLDLVGLPLSAKNFPHQLSGGQQQRIALARALAPAPELLLLDEPFSGLDAELREALAGEVRALLKSTGVTALLVTHDQHEAFAMADHITLMKSGHIIQSDTPENLYRQPANAFACEFIGEGAVVACSSAVCQQLGITEEELSHHSAARFVLVRPEAVDYCAQSPQQLLIQSRVFRGAQYLYQLQLPGGGTIPCLTPTAIDIPVGDALPIKLDVSRLVFLADD